MLYNNIEEYIQGYKVNLISKVIRYKLNHEPQLLLPLIN